MKNFCAGMTGLGMLIAFLGGVAFALFRGAVPVVMMWGGMACSLLAWVGWNRESKKEEDPELKKFCEMYGRA